MKKNEQNKSNKMSTLWTKLSHSAWQKAVTVMAAVVLFCTVYALILPAATLTGEDADEAEGIYLEQEEDAAEEVAIEAEAEEDDEDLGSIEVEGEEAGSEEEAEIVEAEDGEDEEETTTIAEADETEAAEVIESESGEGEGETTEASEGGEGSESGSESTGGSGSGSSESGSIGGGEVVIGGDDYVVIDPAEGVSIEDLIETPAEESSEAIEGESEAETLEAAEGEIPAEELEGETEVVVADEQAEYFVGNLRYVKKKDYKINVAVTEEAEIPVGAKLKVRELKKGTDEYNEHLEQAKAEVLDGTNKIQFARFFDISFELDGEEIEPAADVDVTITYAKKVEIPEEGSKLAVHFTKDEGIEVLEATGAPETIIEAVERPVEEEVKNYAVTNRSLSVAEDNEDAKAAVDEEKAAADAEAAEAAADEAGMFEDDEEEGELYRFSFTQSSFSVVGTVVTTSLTGTVMTADGETYIVTVNAAPEAEIPDGAYLEVSEITSDSESFHDYYVEARLAADKKLTRDAVEAEYAEKMASEDVSFAAKFFDINILDAEGNKIQPAKPVSVNIELWDEMTVAADAEIKTVHFEQDAEGNENPVVIDSDAVTSAVDESEKILDSVSFDANGFSVYAIVGGESTTVEYISEDGTNYEVSVYFSSDANIPAGSKLSVTEFDEDSEEYINARKALLASKKENSEQAELNSLNVAALDISIIDPDGNEIEPDASVKVEIKIKNLPGVEDLSEVVDTLEVQHHVETENGVIVETVFEGDTEVAFTQETNAKVIEEKGNEAVDPESISDNDFINNEGTIDLPQIEELDLTFETEAFSTYTISWGNRSYDIHYVDTEGNSLTPTRTPEFSNGYKFLIYDVEGYEYDSTHYGSRTGTAIKPLLANYGNDRVYLDGNNNWQYLRNDIYVVYKKSSEPTEGGEPKVDGDETWPEGDETPQFGKSSTNNGNGTNTISLSIAGGEKPVSKSTPADVIVVFDISGSMSSSMGGQTRLNRAKTAVNTMAKALLDGENKGVRMALVPFSTTAYIQDISTDGFTNSYDDFSRAVNGLGASGGTNWEQSLKIANQMDVRKDAATFVVFVTDGDPTFRVSRGDVSDGNLDLYSDGTYEYYRNNSVFGEGNDDSDGRNFDFAVDQVAAINGAKKQFYAIGISNDVTKVRNLTTEGGVAADHAFIASDAAAMEAAFKSITESIKAQLGFGDVEITDGITALTNAEMKVMQTVDPNSFKYYRIVDGTKSEWTTREADGCAAATYNSTDGAVHWDMGEGFQLEDGVTYVVEFTVWPSQAAYDLVADLNNGLKTYASLTEAEKAQVVEVTAPTETTTGTYALKTNTDQVNATYNKTTKTGDTVTISDTTDINATYHEGDLENMSLDSDYITVKKEWHNALDSRVVDGITLTVTKDGADYLDDLTLNDGNSWTSDEQYISAGFITKTSDGRYNVREAGHEYTVTEPANFSYYWDLTADVYRPMVIDGELTMLIKTDSPTGTEGTDYYVIGGNKYQISSTTTPQLVAKNDRRSNLNLKKLVTANTQAVDKVPDPDDVFTYTITVTDINGDAVWFGAQDESGATVLIESYSPNVTPEVRDEQPTGSYSVPSGAEFTISIKAGWNVRFFNLPTGTTYSIQETGMVDGYEFVKAETSAEVTDPDYADDYEATPGTVSGDTVTGTIDQPNNVYSTEYTNNWNPSNEIVITKVDEKGTKIAGAQFKLSKKSADGWTEIATFTSKADAGETLTAGRGLYKLEETAAAPNYAKVDTVIYFRAETNGNTTTVTLTDEEGKTETTYPDVTASGNEVTVKNWPLTTAEATKAWKNADGTTSAPQGASVVFTLYADGTATDKTITLDGTVDETGEDKAWVATFTDLPKYKVVEGEAVEIIYTIAETTEYTGYTVSGSPATNGGTITNTQNEKRVTATKAWKNADGSDTAPTGATVVFTLYDDGVATKYTVTLDGTAETTAPTVTGGYESAAWTASFVHVPDDGSTYTVVETTGYDGYTMSGSPAADGGIITNTQKETSVTATKAWKNADGSDTAPTGATVVFTLYDDGVATKYTVTLDGTAETTAPTVTGGYESAAWTASFVHVPDDGSTYTVVETTGYNGYTMSGSPASDKGTITNTQDVTEADATKAWVNADGTTTAPEGATVVFTLYADGTATDYTVELTGKAGTEPEVTGGYESEGWKATFVNLPKYQLGTTTAIVYTIAETTTYPGYTASTTAPVASKGTITNTQEATTANATKAWKNADGTSTAPEGATVGFTLYADGEATKYTVTLDGTVDTAPTSTAGYESAAWKAEFINLPKYQAGTTTAIVYTVAETTTYPGYTASTTGPVASGETITNEQGSTDTYATKAWKNADGTTTVPEGATVTFTLYADGNKTRYFVTLDGTADETVPEVTGGYESEAWKATFVKLPQYQADGKTPIVYTIDETTEYPGYTKSNDEPVGSGSVITNTQEDTSVNALKAWKNADGTATAPQGGQVTFTLYADGTATKYTVTLDGTADTAPTDTAGYESEAWKAEFVNLPKSKIVDGKAADIVYTIAETTGYPGYTASTTEPVKSGDTITNTQEATSANALKAWKNADGTTTAPTGAEVTFTLYADGEPTEYTVTLDGSVDTKPTGTAGYESAAWKAEFINLPKYKIEAGETTEASAAESKAVEIVYTVAETTPYAGYTASTTEPVKSGDTITNTQEATTANALKAWENADGSTKAPEKASVVYTLYADGKETKYTATLDGTVDTAPTGTAGYEKEAWKAEFINLPKYQAGTTTEIVYTVAETTTYPGYTASTEEPVESGKSITNTQDTTEADATKEWVNADGTTTAPEGAKVVFTLYADGTATKYTVELDGTAETTVPTVTGGYESEPWKATFVELPMYKAGTETEIVYTIKETTTYPGYTASTEEAVASGETITNTQEATTADATKAWANADGTTEAPEGAKVVFTLYADGTATKYTVELDGTAEETAPTVTGGYESEPWKATFVELPMYKAGTETEIAYTIAETTTYPGYTASTTDPVASGQTITNKQDTTAADATKAWKNADGSATAPEGATVVFTLYADGTATEYTVTLDGTADTAIAVTGGYESEAWKAAFVSLPKYQADGKTEIVYTIAETTGYDGYAASTKEAVASGETITNSQIFAEIGLIKIGDGDLTKLLSGVKFGLYMDKAKKEPAKDASGKEVGAISTGEDGKATVGKLIPGTYYLAEEKTVEGYRLLKEPVEITITAKDDGTCTVKYTQADYSESNNGPTVTEDGLFELTINNTAGTELPSTGGVGTTIFYILGSILAAGAAILLFVRKRLGR